MQRMTDSKYTPKVIFSLFLEERKRDRRMYYIEDWKQQFLISVMLLTVFLRHQDIYIFLVRLKESNQNYQIVNKWFAWGGINFWIDDRFDSCLRQTFNSNSFFPVCVQLMPCSYVSLFKKSRYCIGCVCKKEGERLFAKTKLGHVDGHK